MLRRLFITLLLLQPIVLMAQEVSDNHIAETAEAFIRGYLGSSRHEISGMRELGTGQGREIYVIDLKPEGWLLMSREYSVLPVLAFSLTGTFVDPPDNEYDNRSVFLAEYVKQLSSAVTEKSSSPDPGWDPSFYYRKSAEASAVDATVLPLIKVTWNQGSGWNRFCPEDKDGPGGHVYAGCVAVSMAQAMSVYGVPSHGQGTKQYDHPVYGSIYADFSAATYDWANMKPAVPDDNNALILYHCAISVDMDFSPDGSGTVTSAAASTAMKEFFYYSKKIAFIKRGTDTELWKSRLDSSLLAGCPIIYSGFPDVGSIGHAFNIDGVHKSNYYHVNWGWSGVDDGYFTIDNFRPGGSDFTKGQTAILRIRPYYYPTGVDLSDTLVLLNLPAGRAVGEFSVIDEAVDNTYNITLECDSVLSGTEWIMDYYLDGDSVRAGRTFERADGPVDTITFVIKDAHGNLVRSASHLLLTASVSVPDVDNDDAFSIFPVPVTDQIMITLPYKAEKVTVTSLNGHEVANVIPDSDRLTIPAGDLPAGFYIVSVYTADGRRLSKPLVKN